jgi:hypothetical protein
LLVLGEQRPQFDRRQDRAVLELANSLVSRGVDLPMMQARRWFAKRYLVHRFGESDPMGGIHFRGHVL